MSALPHLMQPDWNDVHHFTVLVERETLTAAAEALNVQHSTVSRRIERLEQTLGLRLFDRIGKRYLLTEDGARLYQHARGLATDMQQLGRIARETVQAMSKVIVSAPPLIAKGLLMPHFAEFRRRQPRICLTLHSEVQLSNLHRRQADIALRLVRPAQDDLVARRLRPVHYRLYAHRDYLRHTARADWSFLTLDPVGAHGLWLAETLAQEQTAFICNDFGLIRDAVAQQCGIGLLPDFCVRREDPFCQVTLGDAPTEFAATLYLVLHEGLRHATNIRAVADFLVEKLEEKTK